MSQIGLTGSSRRLEVVGSRGCYSPTTKDVFVWAVSLGYLNRLKDDSERRPNALINRFTLSEHDKAILLAIAIVDTGDPEVVVDQAEVIKIAESYAEGGVEDLAAITERPGDPLGNVIDYALDLQCELSP